MCLKCTNFKQKNLRLLGIDPTNLALADLCTDYSVIVTICRLDLLYITIYLRQTLENTQH